MAIVADGKLPGALAFHVFGKFCVPAVEFGVGSSYFGILLRLFPAVFVFQMKLRKLAVANCSFLTHVPVAGMNRFAYSTG